MIEINASKLTAASVFKFGYYAHLVLIMPFCLLYGLLGLGGMNAVTLDGATVYGVKALLIAVATGLLAPAFLAAWLVLGSLLLRLFRDRAPALRRRG